MGVPKDLLYTKEHTWVKIEGALATLGITYYAQYSLGEITFIDLPGVGESFVQSQKIAVLESVKAATELSCPLSGKVAKINQQLEKEPGLINKFPYDKGWILVLEVKDLDQARSLMNSGVYESFLETIAE